VKKITLNSWKQCASALLLALALASCGSDKDDAKIETIGSLRLIGEAKVPAKTLFENVEFGGISGIDRAPDGSYWAISDDRGGERGIPRFYQLALDFDATSFKSVTVQKMVYIRDINNAISPGNARTLDPEGIRVAPNGNLYISSEGNYNASAALRYQPFVREFTKDGFVVRGFDVPEQFNYVDNATSGARSNKSFEALAITPNGFVYTANEDALIEDGPITSLTAGSVVRVMKLDPATGKQVAQYAYNLPPIPVDKAPTGAFAPDNGLPELLAVSDTEFIAIERAFADGVGNTIRLILTSIESDTTDVKDIKNLNKAANVKAMTRKVLLDMPITYQGVKLDNIEGITWGPRLPNGNRTLVLVSDNNFADNQVFQFLAFEVLP
jgi:hypothetical protein